MKKLNSSAILVALTLGVVVSALVIGASVAMSHFSKMSSQARDGRAAYRAALSGIEDGLLRYKYARSDNTVNDLMGDLGKKDLFNTEGTKMEYDLTFKSDPPSVGSVERVEQNDIQGYESKINIDNTLDIDLTYFTSQAPSDDQRISNLEVYFTPPYEQTAISPTLLANYFTAINIRVVDISTTFKAEEQLIWEQTNTDPSLNKITIGDISRCMQNGTSCHLRVRPQIASRTQPPNPLMAARVSGSDSSNNSRFIFYAIKAEAGGEVLKSTQNTPGSIVISSVGIAGGARRKIEARIDVSSGNYLGLFDYGVYCGKECSGL